MGGSEDEAVAEEGEYSAEPGLTKEEMKQMLKKRKIKKKRESSGSKRGGSDMRLDGLAPWQMERECILLLLRSRIMLREMFEMRLKQERIAAGELTVSEIQKLLSGQKEDDEQDWVKEIQELKANLVNNVRKNHVLEGNLSKLDKRIALLIKNRGNLEDIIHASQGLKGKKKDHEMTGPTLSDKALECYRNLFYLLQTEPKYLAKLVYLIRQEQMNSFLDTVLLTLFGDAFSPREEFLILSLFKIAIGNELQHVKRVGDFVKQDSVVPKMVVSYNKRKQGAQYLQTILPSVLEIVTKKQLNLELKPEAIYANLINEEEIATGQKSSLPRDIPEEEIMKNEAVAKIIDERVTEATSICQLFFDAIIGSVSKLPYGIRWICKQIQKISESNFPDASPEEYMKVSSYFVFYRFINLAIVSPEGYDVVRHELPPAVRKNLATIAKVLQYLFSLNRITRKSDKALMRLNDWIDKNLPAVKGYFEELVDVLDPEDQLQVDRYMELTQKTKPVIIISIHEIVNTHKQIKEHLEEVAKEKDDPLRLVVNDLGDDIPEVSKDDEREIQLTLTNRFKQNVEEEISKTDDLYMATKELVIKCLRLIPMEAAQEETLTGILKAGRKYAKDKSNTELSGMIESIYTALGELETARMVSQDDNYASFLRDVALEVANRVERKEQQKKEIKRLTQTLANLREHQGYLEEQSKQFNDYLLDCRKKHYQPAKPKHSKPSKAKKVDGDIEVSENTIGPFKFKYSQLEKKGVIVDSEVPVFSRKKTVFYISSDQVGVFDVVCKISLIEVEKMRLELDDLLERKYNSTNTIEIDQITLDVNMTIHLLNKFFLMAK